jgi:hypothetical protein
VEEELIMAYSRWGWDGSDLYVYMDTGGYLNCTACPLMPLAENAKIKMNQSFHAHSTMDMIDHLGEHMDAGHNFPDNIIADILCDDEINFPGEDS